ncbi:hypothetical protein JCM10908_006672 [Rhodotorula pacifica]|uniref:Rad24p n=1 Tax=Rhodotorula pacifica TaxID=1495444 RepID=UPI003171FF95
MPKASTSTQKPLKSATLQQFSISAFLPSATAPASTSKPTKRPTKAVQVKRDEDDEGQVVLSDSEEESDQDFKKPIVPSKRTKMPRKAVKAPILDLTADEDDISLSTTSSSPAPSQSTTKKQPKPDKGKGKEKEVVHNDAEEERDDQLWVDKYAPTCKDDLSIHARKLTDVETWLTEAFSPNPKLAKWRRVLVLSGPSGAGKTATVKMLAKEMEAEVVEWREGQSGKFGDGDPDRESLVHRFTSFLARAGMAPALDFGPEPIPSSSSSQKSFFPPPPPSATKPNARRLILLEDLPNVSHWPTKLALRSAVQQYLSSPRVTAPLVIIISEALARPGDENGGGAGWLSGNGRRGESIDARGVLGVEILNHPACRDIQFRPIAPTIMRKALSRTLDRIYSDSASSSAGSKSQRNGGPPRSSRPSTATLDMLISHSSGDIRSALMSLQFLASEGAGAVTSLGTGAKGSGLGKKKAKKRKRGRKDEESSDEEEQGEGRAKTGKDRVRQLLSFVTARESSLFIFHALGKVLYNKRWGQSAEDDKKDLGRQGIVQEREYDRLPKHLRKEWERAPSKVDPDVLFAEAPLDTDVFMTYLHHNYPPFTNTIEECSGIMDALSAAETLMSTNAEGEEGYRRLPLTSLYGFQLSVRGTLLSLPSPVPRRKQVLRKSELWENVRLQRQNEEGVEEVMLLERKRAMQRIALLGGAGEAGTGAGELKKTMLCEMVPWLGVIKPKDANPFLVDLATFPPLAGSEQDLLTGAALGENDLDVDIEELDEGVLVDTSFGGGGGTSSPTKRGGVGAGRRSALQEVEEQVDGGEEDLFADGAGVGLPIPRGKKAKDAKPVLLYDPDDDIADDV